MGECENEEVEGDMVGDGCADGVKEILRKNFFASMNAVLDEIKKSYGDPRKARNLCDLFSMSFKDYAESLGAYDVLTKDEFEAIEDRISAIEDLSSVMFQKEA